MSMGINANSRAGWLGPCRADVTHDKVRDFARLCTSLVGGDFGRSFVDTVPLAYPCMLVTPLFETVSGARNVVHCSEEYTFRRPIRIDDTLFCYAKIGAPRGSGGRSLGRTFCQFAVEILDLRGDVVMYAKSVVMDLGGIALDDQTSGAPRPIGVLQTTTMGPITRTQIERFVELVGDKNSIHTSDAFAREAGLDGVVVPGMMLMAVAGHLVSDATRGAQVQRLRARFDSPVRPGDVLCCYWNVAERPLHDVNGRGRGVKITFENQAHRRVCLVDAEVAACRAPRTRQ